jgi:hypothetical protein
MEEDRGNRGQGRVIDCELLATMEPVLFIHRFVDAIWDARKERKRYLFLRAGDEIAISVAGDASGEVLERITVTQDTEEK